MKSTEKPGLMIYILLAKSLGLWFYTSRADLDNLCYLNKTKFPTLVLCENSLSIYEIKK